MRTVWGVVSGFDDERELGRAIESTASGGEFDGIAAPAQAIPDLDGFVGRAGDAGLLFVPQVFTWGRTVDDHLDVFRTGLERVASVRPPYVIAQAGRDSFNDDEARRFLREALAMERDNGVPVAFETHRTRILFTPWRTAALVAEFEDLKLNCDLSHWVCVSERLGFGRDAITACAARTLHVDARVGFENGPQVSDPRAPEYAAHLDAHFEWWSEIRDVRAAAGAESLSFMPEFGPPPYQPVLPFGGGPIGDIDEINRWMASEVRRRLGG